MDNVLIKSINVWYITLSKKNGKIVKYKIDIYLN